ncbi:hypothetical protein Tco_0109215 [Tanacetum coccineum]
MSTSSLQAEKTVYTSLTFILVGYYTTGTPMSSSPKQDVDFQGIPIYQTKYLCMIRGLIYLTASRPDIMFSTSFYARYHSRSTEKYLKEVKWIFQYLKKTIHIGLWYPKDFGFEPTAYSDADHAGCLDTCKSTSGGTQFLGQKLVCCSSKKQDCIVVSTVEALLCTSDLNAHSTDGLWLSLQQYSNVL